ncbi:Endonuclease/exonuclease/phosphatase [Trema orientale]|uniref:Endonuclease/exonuclease/phosphatase n=1 Tax=Trema orientale TaxID=63057 RepID=A0A2P5EZR3_TREOI|nr:Endonuclease/exonuclease/phosphatase [Trema orientale]
MHRLSFVYGASSASILGNFCFNFRELWNSFLDLVAHIWCVIGDFHVVLGAYETTSGSLTSSYFDFASFSAATSLVDLDTLGTVYTHIGKGTRGLVLSRLDKVLCSNGFLDACTCLQGSTLPRHYSDHHPLLLSSIPLAP